MAILVTFAFYTLVGIGLKTGFTIAEGIIATAGPKLVELPSKIRVETTKTRIALKNGLNKVTSSLKLRRPAMSV